LALTFLGDPEEAEELIAPVRRLATPMLDTLGIVALAALGDILQEPLDPMPVLERSRLLPTLPDAALDALLSFAGPGAPSMLTIVQIRHLGGALARPAAQPGAVGTVEENYQIFMLGSPAVPELVQPLLGQLAEGERLMAPFASDRRMFNFLGHNADPSTAFSAEALQRLRVIKADRDSFGVIRSNRPVRGTGRPAVARIPRQRTA
jgi:hypothetical protein